MVDFGVRTAVPDDAEAICSLIQEFTELSEKSGRKSPKLDPIQLSEDIASGVVHALIAFSSHNELAGHALYYFTTSVTEGKAVFLEALYVKPQFRRKGIGRRIMQELSRFANCSRITWNVRASSKEAIVFFTRIGAVGEGRTQWWRLERAGMWKVMAESKHTLSNKSMSFAVLMDGEVMDEEKANAWASACVNTLDGQIQHDREKCLRCFSAASLGAIIAQCKDSGKVLGVALFHRNAYSSSIGRFMIVDQLVVSPENRRNGIGKAILAQLAMIALRHGCRQIGFASKKKGIGSEPFFEALNCVNITATEGMLTYRWKC